MSSTAFDPRAAYLFADGYYVLPCPAEGAGAWGVYHRRHGRQYAGNVEACLKWCAERGLSRVTADEWES